jgi:dienelactone hydrolase
MQARMRSLALLGVLMSLPALAKPLRKPIAYEADTRLEGVLVYAGALKSDRPLMRKRVAAGLATLLAQRDAKLAEGKTGAIGFCFGGTTVLELAKSGADLKGVVSFHGGLDAVLPSTEAPKAKILALHGADDPNIKDEDKKAFVEDLRKVKADWQLVEYGGAVHSFTDVDARTPGRAMYDEKTAKRAYAAMRAFFSEVL